MEKTFQGVRLRKVAGKMFGFWFRYKFPNCETKYLSMKVLAPVQVLLCLEADKYRKLLCGQFDRSSFLVTMALNSDAVI